MKINLFHDYRGTLSGETVIKQGEYTHEDLPRGLANYLVENGHAVELDEPQPAIEPEPSEPKAKAKK